MPSIILQRASTLQLNSTVAYSKADEHREATFEQLVSVGLEDGMWITPTSNYPAKELYLGFAYKVRKTLSDELAIFDSYGISINLEDELFTVVASLNGEKFEIPVRTSEKEPSTFVEEDYEDEGYEEEVDNVWDFIQDKFRTEQKREVERVAVKSVVYGSIYGGSVLSIAKKYRLSVTDLGTIIQGFNEWTGAEK